MFVPGASISLDQNEDSLGRSYLDEEEINSAATSDSEGVVVSSEGAKALSADKVKQVSNFVCYVDCEQNNELRAFSIR